MWILKILIAVVIVGLTVVIFFEAVLGFFQPLPEGAIKVRTFDTDGSAHETVVQLWEGPDGVLWLESGHHFRGWYRRAVAHPSIEIVVGDETRPYTAVPLDTKEARAEVRAIKQAVNGKLMDRLYWAQKGFAAMKPVRLDPR